MNIVQYEKGDLITDCQSILVRWRNHFSSLFNVHGVNGDREREIHAAEPFVPELRAFEFDMAIEKLERHKLVNRIPVELIKSGSRTIRSEIHKLITSSWNKEELPEEWKESIIVPIYEYKKGDKTNFSHYRGISICRLRT
jgi:hypothetical protein